MAVDSSGCSLRTAAVAGCAGVYADGGADAGAGNWRDGDDVQHREECAAGAVAVSAAGPAGRRFAVVSA